MAVAHKISRVIEEDVVDSVIDTREDAFAVTFIDSFEADASVGNLVIILSFMILFIV